LARNLPHATIPAVLAVASMVGLPPTAGFIGKEAALAGLLDTSDPYRYAVVAAIAAGSILTFAYGMRFVWGAFATKGDPTPITPEHPGLFLSPNLLAVGGVIAGLLPWVGQYIFAPYAATYPVASASPPDAPGHLTLWAGFTPALALTVGITAAGVGLFAARTRVYQWQKALPKAPDTDSAYRHLMRRVDRASVTITARTQRGSLPLYLALILLTTIALVAGTLGGGKLWPTTMRLWDSPAQAIVAVIIAVGAILTVKSRRRFKAAVLMGITGYGVVSLFALHGAPDLALTQALVETVTLIVLVLVLRRLPPYFSQRWLRRDRWWRALIAVAVAGVVSWVTLVAPTFRVATPVSATFPEETLTFGYGRNIVNVTLVDTRAWDTMGEISVLLAAATGIASLVYLRHRAGRVDRLDDLPERPFLRGIEHEPVIGLERPAGPVRPGRGRHWLAGSHSLPPQRRSVILEVTTRLIFHTAVMFSLFLLFSGHNAPGGGFSAGIVAGIALAMRYLAGGRYELGEAAPLHPGVLLGSGMGLAAGTGLVPMLFGHAFLQSFKVDFTLPIFGDVTVVSALGFDVGVYLVVVGLVLDILRTLGAEVDRHGEATGHAAPDVAHDSPRTTHDDVKPPILGIASLEEDAP
ncbi:MAG TPA: hydrogen gas-evolving membrane-bound hydrogenase subunit E, partial [Beutenbergiaceae bacterium]|nr:hydrogen gas-evolving membrane-bound hydrogenase subunit E [Beutenbergiaceae bacterium]